MYPADCKQIRYLLLFKKEMIHEKSEWRSIGIFLNDEFMLVPNESGAVTRKN